MKFVIAVISAANAVKLNDAPPFFNEPTWRETFPSAAGLVQTGTSACSQAERHFGIACDDTLVQFATGMNGDEDLGQDIIMKGDKFHYQQELAQAAAREGSGVRARWIELPDCPYGALGQDQIALRSDLSNAIIATCKSWQGPGSVAPTPPTPAPAPT